MPAVNMSAPGGLNTQVDEGVAVICSPFSGPRNSPFDARTITAWTAVGGTHPVYANDATNYSTGALSTGIGFGSGAVRGPVPVLAYGFNDDYTPGVTLPTGVAATTSILTAIGGGKSTANVGGVAPTVPYNAQPLLGFGNGGARDAGAGPVFTGFATKMVTAAGTVANGAVVETGWTNRAGRTITIGQNVFGSAVAASSPVT